MAARNRHPRRQRPFLRERFVEAPVSSMKTSFAGSRSSCSANHSRRRICTSERCCSSACAVFFKGDFVTVEETPQHGYRKALAAIGDQPLSDFEQRDVRLAPDQAEEIVALRLDPTRATIAPRRRRRNLALGLEALHPAHRACYAHFETRGRPIARQPARNHRVDHTSAKIVGKNHFRRLPLAAIIMNQKFADLGIPQTDSTRSDAALIQ